uniref:Astacin domain-containing protein n=1 Tax=Parastrongyloides trichosuri TaxID=131310 RepID=A0A0N5A0L9_PARTI
MFFLTTLLLSLVTQIYGAIRIDKDSIWKDVQYGIKIYKYKNTDRFTDVMNNLMENTCLKWNVTSNEIKEGQGINILQSKQKSCYSVEIGANTSKVPNTIFATDWCMNNYYVMLGLVFNALGLSYEHNRDDRDSFVKINNSSVKDSDQKYLTKDRDLNYTTETFGTTYDYGSITHGGAFDYSSRGEQTITPVGDEQYIGWHNKTIGQRSIESFNEYKLFNYLHCNHTCSKNITCYRGGYQHPKKCGHCKCPFPFKDDHCTNLESNKGYCDTIRDLTAAEEEVRKGFANVASCYVKITAKENKKVQITVGLLNFQIPPNDICSPGYQDVVEIIYSKYRSVTGLCLCAYIGGDYPNVTVISDNHEAFIVYKGSSYFNEFAFFYKAVP